MDPTEEHILGFRLSHEVRSGKVSLKDYNDLKPSLDLLVSEQAQEDADREIYDYPGDYADKPVGQALAKVRLEEQRAESVAARGESSCRNLEAGYKFKLKDYPRSDFTDKEYLILRVRHEGSQPHVREAEAGGTAGAAYQNSFDCIPIGVPFRPERVTRRPFVHGTQTATVVGPQGEKVYMDDRGRAKVWFHWDRDAKDPNDQTIKDEGRSCWVRVSQGYAGATHGIQFPPLVGDEVVVDFLEGNPDRPLIVGRVYNETNKPPLQPDNRIQNVVLTPYQHRLMLDDKKASITLNTGGSEEIYLGDAAEDTDYGNNIRLSTKDSHYIQLAKGDKHKGLMIETEAKHKIEARDDPDPGIFLVDKDGKIYLHLDTQNTTINVINEQAGEINIKCEKGTINVIATDITVDAKNKVDIKGGAEISLKAPQIKVAGDASAEIKAPQLKMEGSAQAELKGAMTKVEGSGTAELKGGGMTTISGGLVKIN